MKAERSDAAPYPACEFSGVRPLAVPSSERITRLGGLGPRRVAGMRGAPGKGVPLGAGPTAISDADPTSDPAERWGPLVATYAGGARQALPLVWGVNLPGAPHRGLTIMVATSEPSLARPSHPVQSRTGVKNFWC